MIDIDIQILQAKITFSQYTNVFTMPHTLLSNNLEVVLSTFM